MCCAVKLSPDAGLGRGHGLVEDLAPFIDDRQNPFIGQLFRLVNLSLG